MYVCFYVYKLVIVYLGVSFTHANEWNTSCQSLMMKDNSLKVKVCLFGQNAESIFSIGDVLQVLAVYVKTYQNNMQLTSSTSTKCEVKNKIKICGGPIFVGIHDPQIYILTNVFLNNLTCFPSLKTYPWNYVSTTKLKIDRPQKLAPTIFNDSTVKLCICKMCRN